MCECPSHMHALAYRGLRLKLVVFLRGSPLDSLRRVFELYLELACSGDLLSLLPSILELLTGGWPTPAQLLLRLFPTLYLFGVCACTYICVCIWRSEDNLLESTLSCHMSARDQNYLAASAFISWVIFLFYIFLLKHYIIFIYVHVCVCLHVCMPCVSTGGYGGQIVWS